MDILLVVLLVMLLGGVGPWWPYSHHWGSLPAIIVTAVIIAFIVRLINSRNTPL